MNRIALFCLSAVLLTACTHMELTERERMQLDLRYRGNRFELAQSMWVAPFYKDDSRLLLTRAPPNENILIVDPGGAPILPGDAQGVLPAGTKVTVTHFTFPGGWQYAFRPLMTPRDDPWLEMTTSNTSPEYVLVLPPNMPSEEAVFQKIGDVLTDKAVDREVAALPPLDQQMIKTKQVAVGVSVSALELTFGEPNFRHIVTTGSSVSQDWTWFSDTMGRTVHIKDGVVVSFEQTARAAATQ